MGFLRPKSPPPPPPIPEAPEPLPEAPTPPTEPDMTPSQDIGAEDAETTLKKKGRRSTILTSSLGLTEPATVRKRTLLG